MRIQQYQASIERLEARWTCSLIPRQRLQIILKTSEASIAAPRIVCPLKESVAPGSLSTPASESIDFLLELDGYEDQEKYPDTPFLDPEEAVAYDLLDSDEDDAGDGAHDEAARNHERSVKRIEPSRQGHGASGESARWSKQRHEASSEGARWSKQRQEPPVEATESSQVDSEGGGRIEWNLPVSHQSSYLSCIWPMSLG